ncbi:MAG TPA: M48 family metalloprotease [Thermoanaerobaculia bacterium]|jgi:Zn-dependent protease with chaperone function/predicted negative regulator of RcsB-dependent stress response|nr:M48 family metalloprotease [Thermoanaerobaculia bacterium]
MNHRRILASALVFLLVFSTARPGRTQGIANPDLFDKSLKAAAEAAAQYGTPDDPEQLARVNRIGYELAQQSEYQKFPFTFAVVDMPVPNAFALPGGQIFITSGMLDLGLDDDMLANVLGHEIGHVVLEHFARMQRKATLMNVLGTLLVAGVAIGESNSNRRQGPQAPYDPRVGYDPGGDLVQGAAAASLVLSELLLRSYSREHEDEADKEGQRLASAAGYDPDGARRLWEKMNNRAPQLREYGYWQTHPFGQERMRAADVRKELWKIDARKSADEYRKRTQATLSSYLDRKKPEEDVAAFVKQAILAAWPSGKVSDGLRLEKLHKRRDEELARPVLSRDYGAVLRLYREELAEVRSLDAKSDLIAALEGEISDLDAKRKELFPRAVEVLGGGIYETSFLTAFLSNFPEAKEVPEVALALGDAYSRLGNRTDAVAQYLKAWEAAPESPEGKRARMGLRNLAPSLQELAALQQMAEQEKDPELKKIANDRLAAIVKTYEELSNGAEYLRRYPEGPYVVPVIERLNVLADNLYGEVVLYQSVGDSVKAMERINKILTHAPLSPAAEKLRDRAVLTAEKAS